MTSIFWELTDDQIMQGINMVSDIGEMNDHPMNIFNHDITLQILAGMWLSSDKDKTTMKIKFADEILKLDELQNLDSDPWFAAAGLNRGVITLLKKFFIDSGILKC
jgi:hypothetical protein